MKTLNKLWWLTLLRGIVLILVAFFVFRHPISALIGIALYIGISLLFTGITQTILSLITKSSNENWGWGFAGGLIEILFAVILLSNPAITAATLPFIVGFWIIVSGVLTLSNAFQIKKEGVTNWWWELISGLLSIVIGFIISNNILAGSIAITVWIGIGFLLAGFINIKAAIAIKSFK